MAKYSNTIEYNLKTNVDISGISKFQAELTKINQSLDALGRKSGFNDTITKQIKSVETLQAALSKAFDPSLGMMNVRKFQSVLAASGTSINALQKNLTSIGPVGSKAFNQALFEVGKLDTQLKTTSSTVDKMFNTLGNTVRWHLTASLVQNFSNEIRRAVDYIKELDTSLNQIRIVTNATNAEMASFAQTANNIARDLGAATTSFTDAALMYAQNGYIMEDYTRLAELTVRTSNVTGQNAATTSEQITSLINGYKMSIDEAESALDKMALVAAQGASDLNELATAEQKVAASANMLGVSQDQLISQISTIISVTRQAPESVGNALKTIYARLGDLKMGETLEDGINLGKVSGTLEKLGVEVLDQTGNLRNMGEIIEDLMDVWNGLTEAQRQAAAVTLAGKHQYTNLIALLDNQEMYQRQLQLTASAEGTLAQQQAIYLDSYTARLQKLKTTGESIISDLFSVDAGKPFLDLLQNIADVIDTVVNAVGGGLPVFTAFFALMTKMFSGNIGNMVQGFVTNQMLQLNKKSNEVAKQEMLNSLVGSSTVSAEEVMGASSAEINPVAYYMKQGVDRAQAFTGEERGIFNRSIQDLINANGALDEARAELMEADALLEKSEQALANEYENLPVEGMSRRLRESNTQQRFQGYGLQVDDYLTREGTPRLTNRLIEVTSNSNDLFDSLTNFSTKIEASGITTMRDLKRAVSSMRGEENEYTDALQEYDRIYNELLAEGSVTFKKIKAKIDERTAEAKAQSQELTAATKVAADEQAAARQQIALKEGQAAAQVEQEKRGLQTFISNKDISAISQNITSIASGAASLVFALQSIKNLGNIWSDETLSAGEKFSQILFNITTTAPMLLMGLTQIQTGLDKLKEMEAATKIIGGLTEAIKTGSQTPGAFATAMRTLGVVTETTVGEVTTLTVSLGALAPAIAGVIAIAGVLGVTIYAVHQYLTRFDRAVEEAQEAVNDANAKYQESIEELNNLQTSLDNIKNAGNVFENLTKGTAEWTEALVNANDQVLALLDTYPELYNYLTTGEYGNLTLTEEGFDVVRENQLNRVRESIAARGAAQSELNRAERTRLLSDTSINFNYEDENGTVRQATLGPELAASIASYLIDNPNATAEEILSAMPELNITLEQLQGALTQNSEELINLGNNLHEFSATEDANVESTMRAYASTMEGFNELDSVGQDYLVSQLVDAYNGQGQELYDQYRRQYIEQELNPIAIANLYSEALGVQATNNRDHLEFVNEKGEIEEISYEEALRSAAAVQTLADASQNINVDNIREASEAIVELNESQDAGIFGIKPEDFKLTEQGFLQVLNAAEDGLITEEEINRIFGEDAWRQAGFESAEEFVTALQEAMNNYHLEAPEIEDNYNEEEIQGILEQAEMSQIAYDAYVDNFYAQHGGAGQYGKEEYSESAEEYFRAQDEATQRRIDALDRLHESSSGAISDEEYERQRAELEELLGAEEAYRDSLEDLATAALETEVGIDGLNKVLKDNIEYLGEGEAAGTDYYRALGETIPYLAQILNINQDAMSSEQWGAFIQDNLSEIQRLAEGDEDALISLRQAAAEPIIASLNLESRLSEDDFEAVRSEVDTLVEMAGNPEIEVGASLDTDDYVASLNHMLETGAMTVEEVESLLGGIGYDVEVGYMPVVVPDFKYVASFGKSDLTAEAGVKNVTIRHTEMVPYIRTVTKKGGGSGYRPSSSSGGGGGGGGKGGKGGGGGSGSSYTPKEMDTNKYKEDRYERVNAELDRTTNELSKLADEQDRLTGDDLNKNLEKQVNLIQQQIKWQEEKLKIQKQEAKEYRDQLAGYGILFNDEGTITNYSKIWNKLNSEHERLVKQYNATTTEEGQKALEEEIKQNEEKLENFEDLIDKYDDLVQNQIKDTEETIQELYNKIEDIQTDIIRSITEAIDESHKQIQDAIDFDYNVNFSLDTSDARTELAKLQDELTALTDSASTNTIATIYAQQIEDLQESISKGDLNSGALTADQKKFYNEKIKELKQSQKNNPFGGTMGELFAQIDYYGALLDIMDKYGSAPVYGNNRAALEEDMQNVVEQMYKYAEEERKLLDDITKARVDIIKQAGDAIKEEDDLFKRQTDTLDYYKDLAEKLYGESAYDEYAAYYETSLKNYQEQAGMLYQTLQFLTQHNEELKAQMENLDKESYAYKALQKEQKALEEQIVDTTEKYRDAVLNSIDVIFEKYEKTIDKIQDGVERVLTSKEIVGSDGALTQVGTSLEFMKEQWELINDKADGYYDAVQSGVEIQKLQLKYQDAINKSNDPKVQKALKDQMEEQLGLLRSMTDERTGQVILSEYQVERANKLLELTQKQYALEDSRANRNQMKLRRDTQGNYSYVYTANQDDVVSRQSDLLDAQSNLYDFDKERAMGVQESAINTVTDYLNRMSELYNERMKATGERAEEITRQIEFLQKEYEDYLTRHIGELTEAQANLAQSFLALMQDLYDNNKQGLDETVDKVVEDTAEGLAEIDGRVGETFINFDNLQSQFGDDNETFLDLLEDNFYDFTKEIEKNAEKTAQAVDDISESIYEAGSATDDLTNSTGEFFDVLVNQVGSLDTYKEGLEEAIDRMNKLDLANENLKASMSKLQSENSRLQEENKAKDATIRDLKNGGDGSGSSLQGGKGGAAAAGSPLKDSDIKEGQRVKFNNGMWYEDSYGGGRTGGESSHGKYFYITLVNDGGSYPIHLGTSPRFSRASSLGWVKKDQISFNTGGYTGSFNDPQGAGRLAILHSKELVLNKEDTINILEAVKTIRSMTENMRNAAFSDSIRLLNDAGADIMTNFATAQQLDQDVHIDATFPNVKDAREIEAAMNNLIDQAAQFIHRNN